MGFPKFNSETFRNAMLGVGALALVSLPSGPAAQEASSDGAPQRISVSSTMSETKVADAGLPFETNAAPTTAPATTPAVATDTVTTQEYPELGPLEVMNYSSGRVVLYTGREVQDLRGIMDYLNEVGRPTTIAYTNNEDGPLKVEPHQFAVFANGKFGGIYTQISVNHGVGADIEIFARNSGVPLQQAALTDDNDATLTAGLY